MAAIGSIRKHSTLLVIVIGGALVAFILGDFMKKNHRRDVNVGKVNGVEISIIDFNKKLDENLQNTKQQTKKNSLSTNETFRVRQQTWDQMVRKILMDKQFEYLGITVTADEMFDLIQGPNPHPLIRQYFVNPKTGVYDRNMVIQYLQNYDRLPDAAKQQWKMLENYIKNDRMRTKYNALIANGYYVPKDLAQLKYQEYNTKANIEYVAARYADVPDSLINVTDEDYQNYYEQHKAAFKQKNARSLEYVSFNVLPSQKDIAKARKEAIYTQKDFEETPDPIQFAHANSDKPSDTSWMKQGQLPHVLDSVMFHSKPGTVSAPYFENNTFEIARLLQKARRPDSMNASHILIAYKGAMRVNPENTRTKEQAKKLADSLYKVLKRNPAKFNTLALKYSDDGSVKKNKGALGWFADGQMVPAFNEAVVKTKKGHFTEAESPFGFHIIKVIGKKDFSNKIKVALITQEVVPSNETFQKVFAKASRLASESHNLEAFETAVKKNHYQLREMPKVYKDSYLIPGLQNPREIIRWAFKSETDEGVVSNVFDLEGQYVVAVVTKKFEEGIPSMEEVKNKIKPFVINQVKGKFIAEKMKSFKGNFNKMANALKLKTQSMNNITFNTRNLIGFGMEDKVIGTVFGMKPGTVSQPIIGNAAAFDVKVDKITPAGKIPNYNQFVRMLTTPFRQRVQQDYPYVAIKDAAEIKDNRISFF